MTAVEIETPERGKSGGKVALDGNDVANHIRGFTLKHDVRHGTQLTLDIPVHQVTSLNAASVELMLPPPIAALLERAGWTPPPSTASVLKRNADGCPCEWRETNRVGNKAEMVLGRTVPTCPEHGASSDTATNLIHDAWGVIANAMNVGDPPVDPVPGWHEAAARWRDRFHAWMDRAPTAETSKHNDIHGYFGLSYANYFVAPRSLLQSMPLAWQWRFTALLAEYGAAFDHVLLTTGYNVESGKWCCLSDLTDADMERLSIKSGCTEPEDTENEHECGVFECTYFDRLGDEIDQHTACVFVPGTDPVPHYDRGRTRVQRADELEGADRG